MSAMTAKVIVRVPKTLKQSFIEKCEAFGPVSDVHRELIAAFVEGRVTIKANPDKPTMGKLYQC